MPERFFEGINHADLYAKFRPVPPVQLAQTVVDHLNEKYDGSLNLCVDLGCGNGQCSALFAPYFKTVLATDISAAQIELAKKMQHPTNVLFDNSPAENIPVEDGSVQLINACSAAHWFDIPAFFREAHRVLSPNGVIALSCHDIPHQNFIHPAKGEELRREFEKTYCETFRPFWGEGNSIVIREYADIKFPYPDYAREYVWADVEVTNLKDIGNFLATTAPYQNCIKQRGQEEADELLNQFFLRFKKILETDANPEEIEIRMRRRYFLVMGRKPCAT